MGEEQFRALVKRLEAEAARAPGLYRLKVAGLTALGFGYVFGVLALALGLLGAVGWAYVHGTGRTALRKAGLAIAYVVYAIGRALWVRFERPGGREIRPEQAPRLFELIERTRRAMRAPRVHRVLIESDLNAAVLQHPRLGILGWQENHLLLGLPLLQATTPEQFQAVLAHEFGHLSGAHSRFGGWICRTQETWRRLLTRLEEEEHWSSFVFRPFFRWYAPYFSAYTFVLRRANEYRADRDAAELTSARTVGDALAAVSLKGTFLSHRFWPRLSALADQRPEPDVAPFASMARALASQPDGELAEPWLAHLIHFETELGDSHPSLGDRLAALGIEARAPAAVEPSAADALLGEHHAELARALDAEWRAQVEERWRAHFASEQAQRERLAELDARASREALGAAEAWERARLTERRGDAGSACALYRALADAEAGHAPAHFAAGRLLLAAGDAQGIEYVERAMELSAEAVVPGCELVADFLGERGEAAKAAAYEERGAEEQRRLDAIEAERSSLPLSARYLPHAADPDRLEALQHGLASLGCVKRAHLVRKHLELSREPLFVLGVTRRRSSWRPRSWGPSAKAEDLALQQRIADELPLPGDTHVLVLNHRDPAVRKRLFEPVEGSRILG